MKSIPSSVTVGGIKFRIVVAGHRGGDFGGMNFDDRTITINPTCLSKRSLVRETLRHEIFHAATHVSGIAFMERYDEEAVTRAVENVFFPAWERIQKQLLKA